MKKLFKQYLPYIAAIFIFYVIAAGYFTPVIFEGKKLNQTDIRKGQGMSQDITQMQKETGEKSLWASRMFSGMPAYQISPSHATYPVLNQLRNITHGFLPDPASHLFAYMLGFFILLAAFRINPWLSIIGAIAYAFSSYFLIIIEAGHIWKVLVLEYIPPAMAGIIWAYRGKFITGGVVTGLFFALQLVSNHIQMTYYFLLFVGLFLICRFIYDYKNKQLPRFLKASAVLLVAGAIAFGANATSMILSQKYSEQTIRGKSELTDNTGNKTSGLDKDYATQWSYGIGETFTLLIPDTKGGATGTMGMNHPKAVQRAGGDRNMQQVVSVLDSYWGDQPFTSGPVYAGAFIVFLFIFGLFIVKGYLKWALVAGTIFSILLSWGHNFMGLTGLFLDYFPLYNKFRAVSSILVIAEFTIPVLALLALAKIYENPKIITERKKAFYASLGLTAGVAFIFIIFPALFFNFSSINDVDRLEMYKIPEIHWPAIVENAENARISAFRTDAWRSILIILIGAGSLLLYRYKKITPKILVAGLSILVLFDLTGVDKRYLNNKSFVRPSETVVAWEMTPADKAILEDKDPNYRVFNLSVSPFQDGSTSYYHKSIGGYHAAKLRRYQELIDRHISKMNLDVINMLNARYFIIPDNNGNLQVQYNDEATGNAWFVDSLHIVRNADEEIAALSSFKPETTAIIDQRFNKQLEGFTPHHDPTAFISLKEYKINHLTYESSAGTEQLAIFSEIYYDDGLTRWDALIDGKPASPIRANYVLRALRIPAGNHTIEFIFKPKAYGILEIVSIISLIILLMSIVAYLKFSIYKNVRQTKNAELQ